MGRAWDDAVDREFVQNLIERIKELKLQYGTDSASEISQVVGDATLELINETYEDLG